MEYALLTALGLAAPAGLNAYLPLLILALADRFSTAVTLAAPYDFMSGNVGLAVLVLLLTVEVVVDKIPGLDHANDLIQTVVRPAAGALLALAATSDAVAVSPPLALVLGLVAAGSVHAAKATTRPAVTLASGGLANPLVSFGEDVVATLCALAAIFAPLLVLGFLVLFVAFVVWAFRRLRRLRGRLARPASNTLMR